jgi:hypothetical protein
MKTSSQTNLLLSYARQITMPHLRKQNGLILLKALFEGCMTQQVPVTQCLANHHASISDEDGQSVCQWCLSPVRIVMKQTLRFNYAIRINGYLIAGLLCGRYDSRAEIAARIADHRLRKLRKCLRYING